MFLKVEGGLCLLTCAVQLIQVFVNWKCCRLEHWFQLVNRFFPNLCSFSLAVQLMSNIS